MTSSLRAEELLLRLPHRHPFVLLDRVDDLVLGTSGRAIKNVSISDPVFAGHFPGRPIYPGVLMIEAAAQLCGIVLADGDAADAPRIGYLASVKRFKFSRLVLPGDRLDITSRAGARIAGLTDFAVEIRVGSAVVASGSLAIALPGI